MINRNTIQRQLVLSAARALPHPAAEEVYENVIKDHPHISKATVYRNLNLLVTQGELRKVSVPDGADRFDSTLANHYHLRCVRCGGVFDVDMDYLSDIETRIGETGGFVIQGHDIVFQGICPKCNTKI